MYVFALSMNESVDDLYQAVFEIYSGFYVVAFATDDPNTRRYSNKAAA